VSDKKGCRFYQIGKTGEGRKGNNYKGFISKDGEEFYKLYHRDKKSRFVKIMNKDGELQKKFVVEFSQELLSKSSNKGYVYYKGCDKENIYLNVAFEHGSTNEGFYFDEFIWKYNRNGNLLSQIDILEPLRKMYNVTDNKFIPEYFYISAPLVEARVDTGGNFYYVTTFKNEGLKIFKYSKIK